jgi:hypothetical protein
MEFMEPKDIDWSRVVSRYVRDETYEGIAAPHWADLTDPNAGCADVDDDAWFCRPGTYASPSSPLPFLSPAEALLVGCFIATCEASNARCLLSLVASKNSPVLDPLGFLPWGRIGHIFLANSVPALCKSGAFAHRWSAPIS